MIDVSDGAWWALPVFITVYAVRPLVLFPASVLTVAAGIMFGPVVGVGVVTVGSNVSALVAFQVAKTFAPALVAATGDGTAGLPAGGRNDFVSAASRR